MKHTTLVGATSGGGISRSTTAMDVSSIASVPDTAQNQSAGEPPAVDWAMGEMGWPIDGEGNQVEGYIDGQLVVDNDGVHGTAEEVGSVDNATRQLQTSLKVPS